MKRLIVITLGIISLGCTTLRVEGLRSDGTVIWRVSETGAPLLSRKSALMVKHEWLDGETNRLHESLISRTTTENAEAQIEAVKAAGEIAKAAAVAGGI